MTSITEQEIRGQASVIENAVSIFELHLDAISKLYQQRQCTSICFIGSGSGYCLGQSAALSMQIHGGINAQAIPAGDLLMHFDNYAPLLKNALVVCSTRSGSTSEVLRCLELCNAHFIPSIALCGSADAPIKQHVDLYIECAGLAEESVCQTRAITSFYILHLMLAAHFGKHAHIINELQQTIANAPTFIDHYFDQINRIIELKHWESFIVLADGELWGLADEASMAAKEMAQIYSNTYHVLDLRHGPMVCVNEKSLVLMNGISSHQELQDNLIDDITKKGASIISLGPSSFEQTALHLKTPALVHQAVQGVYLIVAAQLIALHLAEQRDLNPDAPPALNPWIALA